MLSEEQKIIKEYRSLCNRILNKDCTDLELARIMIRAFNHYTERGKHGWDRDAFSDLIRGILVVKEVENVQR